MKSENFNRLVLLAMAKRGGGVPDRPMAIYVRGQCVIWRPSGLVETAKLRRNEGGLYEWYDEFCGMDGKEFEGVSGQNEKVPQEGTHRKDSRD